MNSIVLASASPRRVELMKLITDNYKVCPSHVEEHTEETDVMKVPLSLARVKALDVAKAFADCIVIGADTVVICDGVIFGKPSSDEDAFRMLRALSGKIHTVVTGVCVLSLPEKHEFTCATQVSFYNLSDREIEAYIASGEPFGKAGAYAVQGSGCAFVNEIRGDLCTVIGLPVNELKTVLKRMGAIL